MKDEDEPPFDLRDRTKAFALKIIRVITALPKEDEAAAMIAQQVLRSGTSVGASYREAHRGRSKPEFIPRIGECLKALDDTAYWLELLIEGGIVSPSKLSSLQDECNQLIAIFTTVAKRSRGGAAG